jgi:DNA-binding NarL/FixJ family response regulator
LAEELRLCIDALRSCQLGLNSALAASAGGDGAGSQNQSAVPLVSDVSTPELLEEAARARHGAQQALEGFLRMRRQSDIPEPLSVGKPVGDHRALSKREREVLVLIVAGKTSKQIAAQLGISFKTAVTHRTSIMDKLQVHEIASLVREAIRQQMV